MMGNMTGGLGLVNQQGSWVISPAQSDQTQGSMPTMLPGGVQRQSINHMQSQQMQQAQMQSYYQRMATLNQVAALERLAAFNQVRQYTPQNFFIHFFPACVFFRYKGCDLTLCCTELCLKFSIFESV